MTAPTVELDNLSDAFARIDSAKEALRARAAAAGLDCRISLWAFGGSPPRVGIKLSRNGASFPQKRGGRAISWRNAYSLAEFDEAVSAALDYLESRRK